MESREFGAPWGNLLKLVSLSVTLFLLAMPVILWRSGAPLPQVAAVAALPVAVLGPTLLLTVRGYRLEGSTLLVRRLLWSTAVDLLPLRSVTVDPDAMRGAVRMLGNGGLFAFTGRFRSRKLGPFRAFVTDMASCVVLATDGGTVVVSPESPEHFAELARNLVPRGGASPGQGPA